MGFLALILVAGMSTPAFAQTSSPGIEPNLDIRPQEAADIALLPNIIFDNGGNTPDPSSGNEMTEWIQTEDFAFEDRTLVHDVHFILFEFESDNWDGSLDYYIFADNAGERGNVLASGSAQNLGTNDLGDGPFGPRTEVWFDLEEDFQTGAGVTYHLGLHANTGNDFQARDDVYWEWAFGGFGTTGIESRFGTMDNWFNNEEEHYFLLSGGNGPIGGTVGSMSTTSLLVAGAQANMGLWSLALVGIVGAAAAITYKVKSKSEQ
jgi:hypothetical protein